ncbi:hypothetical protein IF129_11585 [Streptomyces chumphonensis]|uniref:Uncharacterized protein n=1 Tax=Streptomyces chumphonensis TaxID=1214925 RepID=A0A927ICS7_9ACTN|nr:hypothetical protein [Streptomyces chumphonensis]MBD3932190.1 hypothetical protein [Streptomyces chumphonensis]
MPTPHGSRGGMAFSAEELRVLRRALATTLQSAALPAQEIRECLMLTLAVDDATHEAARLRRFLFADVARYRAALPGAAAGYLARLGSALDAGYTPTDEDVTALRRLCAGRTGAQEAARRMDLLVRAALPAARTPLAALPGGLGASGAGGEEDAEPGAPEEPREPRRPERDEPAPERDRPAGPQRPSRPIPTPGEVFPPRRRTPPPEQALLSA